VVKSRRVREGVCEECRRSWSGDAFVNGCGRNDEGGDGASSLFIRSTGRGVYREIKAEEGKDEQRERERGRSRRVTIKRKERWGGEMQQEGRVFL
jgi:hypothetical protein